MPLYLKPTLRWVAGPVGGALYDLASGIVYPVARPFAAAVARHAASGRALDALLGDGTAAIAWLDTLRYEGLLTETPQEAIGTLTARQPDAPKLVWLELTGRCNYTCVHCYADSDPTPTPTLPDHRWFALIDEARAADFPAVQFTGGDPLMHPRLADFVVAAHDAGFETVEVYTNGSLLQQRHFDLFAERGTHVAMSFYSWNPETYNAIVRQPRGHARAVAAIRALLARGVTLRIGVIEMDANRAEVPATLRFLAELGVDPARIHVDAVRPSGRGTALVAVGCGAGTVGGAGFVPLRALDAMDATTNVSATPPIWQAPMPLPRSFHTDSGGAVWNSCWAGEVVLDPDGNVFPCIFARGAPLGNVALTPLRDVLHGAGVVGTWSTNLGDADDCAVCAYRYACFDCRALTVNVAGRRSAKPPSCIYNPHSDSFDWPRWLRQLGDPAPLAEATSVQQRGTFAVVAEDDDGVTVAADDGSAMATLDFLAAVVLDLADGRSIAAIAAAVAAERGEAATDWHGPALMAAWELEQRGLVACNSQIGSAVQPQ